MNDTFGDRMKVYEQQFTEVAVNPRLPIYARLDGRAFSSFTRGFEKPFDMRMSNAMHYVASTLVEHTHALIGYTQSDEISLLWNYDNDAQPFFGGKIQKMCSVLSGLASAAFVRYLASQGMDTDIDKLPHFDCRVINLPSKTEAVNMILWRTQDAVRNAISMAASANFSHKQLEGVSTGQRSTMLVEAGVNFDAYPAHFRWGQFIRRVTREVVVTEGMFLDVPESHRPPVGSTITRSFTEFVDMPERFNMVSNREGFIFRNEKPYIGWNGV